MKENKKTVGTYNWRQNSAVLRVGRHNKLYPAILAKPIRN